MMENEKFILIVLVAVILALAVGIGYFFLFQPVEYQTIQISSGSTIDVPKADDVVWQEDPNGIRTYSCPSKRVSLISFNSAENLTLVGAGAFAIARDALMAGTSSVEMYKGYEIMENSINGTHYYLVNISSNETHDNIVIGSGDLDILKHMLDTLSLGAPKQVDATLTSSGSVSAPVKKNVTQNTTAQNNRTGYSQDDVMNAYSSGYSDGYSDSVNEHNSNPEPSSQGIDAYSYGYNFDEGGVDNPTYVETTTG